MSNVFFQNQHAFIVHQDLCRRFCLLLAFFHRPELLWVPHSYSKGRQIRPNISSLYYFCILRQTSKGAQWQQSKILRARLKSEILCRKSFRREKKQSRRTRMRLINIWKKLFPRIDRQQHWTSIPTLPFYTFKEKKEEKKNRTFSLLSLLCLSQHQNSCQHCRHTSFEKSFHSW